MKPKALSPILHRYGPLWISRTASITLIEFAGILIYARIGKRHNVLGIQWTAS
jgi:hypothetical protein